MTPTVEMIDAGWKAGLGLTKLQVERILVAALAVAPAHAARVKWEEIKTAPKDGTMLRLLVNPDRDEFTAFDDGLAPFETIGFNNLENTEEDRWEFAGWDWSQDCFITGRGEVIGWAEMPQPVVQLKPLEWSDPCDPNEDCRYNHVTAKAAWTYQIEWKAWKEHDSFAVYRDGDYVDCKYSLDEAKAFASADRDARIFADLASGSAQPMKEVRAAALEEAANHLDEKALGYEEDAHDVSQLSDDRRFAGAVAVRLRGSAAAIRSMKESAP